MSNVAETMARREEEIAFLAMEQVLGVDITLADAGGGDSMPDGIWTYPGEFPWQGIVEVTSPPASGVMREWAAAKREGRPQREDGSIPTRLGELGQVCGELLAADWATENLDKLRAQTADERHLFLFARSEGVGHYFRRLSDWYNDGTVENVDNLVVPDGVSDVWFRGGARRGRDPLGQWDLWLARFQGGSGWHRYVVTIDEQSLPSPNPKVADDPAPIGWRSPKHRSASSAGS